MTWLVVTVGLSIFFRNLYLFRFGGRTKVLAAFNGQAGRTLGPFTITMRAPAPRAISTAPATG